MSALPPKYWANTLQYTSFKGDVELVEELLASKKWHVDEAPWIVVGKKLRTKSPLCLTAKAGEEAVIRVLLRWGATVLEEDTTHKGEEAGL
jgi:hypothetical protein